jgi:uncharacterized membrane protein (DUF2068 family)
MSDSSKKPAVGDKPRKAPTLYFIVAVKLLKGIAALILAIVTYTLSDNNLPEEFRKMLEFFHLDPEKKFFLEVADRLAEITTSNMNWLAIMAVIYGLFMLLQAVGLAMRVSWVVWLVIGESAFFIPIEIFKLVSRPVPGVEPHHHLIAHPKIGVLVILLVNIGIVWYLFQNRNRIIKHHHH